MQKSSILTFTRFKAQALYTTVEYYKSVKCNVV